MKIYCSGIGGIGLSAYAALQNAAGHTVQGSDRAASPLIEDLRGQGIEVFLEQDGSHVSEDLDLFVYSEAIPEDAPERVQAKEFGIEQQSYFKALGELSKDYRVIAVCGTHGKSSTTAMAAKLLIDAGWDPTVVVGTKVPDLDGRNWRKGESDLFLLEACEYRRSFLHLEPTYVLMTNVDGDHFDYYQDVEDYHQAFREFLTRPWDVTLVTHMSDPDCASIAESVDCLRFTADVLPLPKLNVPGKHMQENAQLTLGLIEQLGGLSQEQALQSLQAYRGCWRRLENKGFVSSLKSQVPVYDDYGHHPREIRPTIAALKEAHPDKRLVCVFQPHMHDRTLKLYDEFVASFDDVDMLIIPNIYDARADVEKEHVEVDKLVADIAAKSGREVINGQSLGESERLLQEEVLQEGDVVLCMGAGDITKLATTLVT